MADNTCPPLPCGSFELNALHDAAKKGEDMNEAIAKQLPTPEPAVAAAAADEPADPPAKAGSK